MVKPVSDFMTNARTVAREIKQNSKAAGRDMSLSHAFEVFAKTNGFRTWAAMKASREGHAVETAIITESKSTKSIFGEVAETFLSPTEVWAFCAVPVDVELRNAAYERLTPKLARKALAELFPHGSAVAEIQKRIAAVPAMENPSDAIIDNVICAIADEVAFFSQNPNSTRPVFDVGAAQNPPPEGPPFIVGLHRPDGTSEQIWVNWTPIDEPPESATVWDAIGDAIAEVEGQTGIELSREQMKSLLRRSGLMKAVVAMGEIETGLRSDISSALSMELIGRSWPRYGDGETGEFFEDVEAAARLVGYSVAA